MIKHEQARHDNQPACLIRQFVVVRVTEEIHIAQAQRQAKALARAAGFRQVAVYQVATSVSELANNLFFHTTEGGRITITAIRQEGMIGLEVIAEDRGPGIPDVKLAMQDGFSANGGLGGGLPGVKRLMDEFEINSEVGLGTRIMVRRWQACR